MTHLLNMIDDQYDYYLYSLRKFTLTAFEGLMKFNSTELYKFKHLVKAAIGLSKLNLKVQKIKEQEVERFAPVLEEYKSSEEFVKLQKTIAEVQEEEEYKKDTDPKGFQKYSEFVSKPPGCNKMVIVEWKV